MVHGDRAIRVLLSVNNCRASLILFFASSKGEMLLSASSTGTAASLIPMMYKNESTLNCYMRCLKSRNNSRLMALAVWVNPILYFWPGHLAWSVGLVVRSLVKSGPPPPINAKQQKAFHHLLSAAAYNSVLEGNTDSTEGLRELCARYYHGFDEDNIGIAASFLQGDGRFGVLWDDNVIAPGFGHLSGLSHAQLSYYIVRPTLKGKNLITGRQILEKGRACLMEAKKCWHCGLSF